MERSSLWGTEHSSKEAVLGDGYRRASWGNCGSYQSTCFISYTEMAALGEEQLGQRTNSSGKEREGQRPEVMSRNKSQASLHILH